MLIAIIVGSFVGTAAAWFLSTRLLELLADRHTSTPAQRRFMKVMGGVLGATVAFAWVAPVEASEPCV